MDVVEQVQRRITKMIKGLEYLSYEERLRKVMSVQPREENAQGYLINVCKCLLGGCKEDGARLFSVVLSGIRGTVYKLKHRKFHLSIRKTLYYKTLVEDRHRLPRGGALSLSLDVIKTQLGMALGNLL